MADLLENEKTDTSQELQRTVHRTPAGRVESPRTFAALKHRNYQLFFIGQLVSVIGTWMQIIAQSWLVYQLSHSELLLGVVGFASAIPALIISPWGGVVVDSVPKRRLLVITQTGAMLLAFVMALLSFAKVLQVWHIVALAALLGVVNSFDAPGRQAFVVEMVGREDLPNAIALNSMMFNGARVVGPAVGGLLLAAVGTSWCFLLNGFSFLAVIAGLLLMQVREERPYQKITNPWAKFTEGIHYAGAHRKILGLLSLAIVFSVFGGAYSALLPAFVDQNLHNGAAGYGIVNTAIGAGAVTGALLVARYGGRGRRGPWVIAAVIIYPLVLAAFAYTAFFPLALVLGFGLGFGFMVGATNLNSLLQLNVSDEMRGRVLSLYTLSFFGLAPFGNLIAGSLAEGWGMSVTIAASAAVMLVLSTVVILTLPELRKID